MKKKIKAQNKYHLQDLIIYEIERNGNFCSLNHIDISKINDLSSLFFRSEFNGDISKWDVSHVFSMENMFNSSKFNSDIKEWDVRNVKYMDYMFSRSEFRQDLSNWKPYEVYRPHVIFCNHEYNEPYWVNYEDKDERMMAIKTYHLEKGIVKELRKELINKEIIQEKKLKI
jgi:hypothetical protein